MKRTHPTAHDAVLQIYPQLAGFPIAGAYSASAT